MAKVQNQYEEIDDIKKDISSLKSNAVSLTHHLADDGKEKLQEAGGQLKSFLSACKKDGAKYYHEAEDKVRENPGQSIALAFAGGLLLSALLKRR